MKRWEIAPDTLQVKGCGREPALTPNHHPCRPHLLPPSLHTHRPHRPHLSHPSLPAGPRQTRPPPSAPPGQAPALAAPRTRTVATAPFHTPRQPGTQSHRAFCDAHPAHRATQPGHTHCRCVATPRGCLLHAPDAAPDAASDSAGAVPESCESSVGNDDTPRAGARLGAEGSALRGPHSGQFLD